MIILLELVQYGVWSRSVHGHIYCINSKHNVHSFLRTHYKAIFIFLLISRAQITFGTDEEESAEEFFVSENVCTSVLYESKNSIKRCREVSHNASIIPLIATLLPLIF